MGWGKIHMSAPFGENVFSKNGDAACGRRGDTFDSAKVTKTGGESPLTTRHFGGIQKTAKMTNVLSGFPDPWRLSTPKAAQRRLYKINIPKPSFPLVTSFLICSQSDKQMYIKNDTRHFWRPRRFVYCKSCPPSCLKGGFASAS
ncbi:MAG: hypothetical protein IJ939_05410 [Clostridia bacterium]|nr:hypothetical protein [Clostridia bacterium]